MWERRQDLAGLVFQAVCTRLEAEEKQNDKEERADEDTTLQDMVVTTAQLPKSQNPSDTAAQRTNNGWRRMNIVLTKFHFIS